ncbi:MAG: maleylacetoacetate isomerase [Rudaea sp.]
MPETARKLYSYWRSSAAYRVRIALNLKGLAYDVLPVHLVDSGGEQHRPEFRAVNPQELIPVLIDGAHSIRQSIAIIEYLDEVYPSGAHLLPAAPLARARVRGLALAIACDVHPLNNTRALQYLERELHIAPAERARWTRHWIALGFAALEELLAPDPASGRFCHGDAPGMADALLVPQLYNARRWSLDLAPYPTLCRIDAECAALDAFERARPENQLDAPKSEG